MQLQRASHAAMHFTLRNAFKQIEALCLIINSLHLFSSDSSDLEIFNGRGKAPKHHSYLAVSFYSDFDIEGRSSKIPDLPEVRCIVLQSY